MNNDTCPDYSSHRMNAEDIYFEGSSIPDTLTSEQDDAITEIADAEYKVCEGH